MFLLVVSVVAGAEPLLAVGIGFATLILTYTFTRNSARDGFPLILCLLFFDYLFVCHAAFRTRDFTDSSIDGQVISRVLIAACLIVTLSALYLFRSHAFRQSTLQKATWVLALFISLGSIYSLTPEYTLVCGIMYLSVTVTTIVLCNLIQPERTFALVCYAMSALMVASVMQLAIDPQNSYIIDYVAGGFVQRFRGLFLHPVQLGNALAPIVIYYCYIQFSRKRQDSTTTFWALGAILAFIMILGANSRISLVSIAFSCGVLVVARYRWVGVFAASILVGVLLVIMITNSDEVAIAFTRSGNISELLTFTGRTEVWAFAWPLIVESPYLGYGFGATRELFQNLPGMLGWTASHAHNMWLQGLLEVGLLGITLVLLTFIAIAVDAVRRRNLLLIALALQLMVRSATEVVIFFYIPGVSTVILVVAVCIASKARVDLARETAAHHVSSYKG